MAHAAPDPNPSLSQATLREMLQLQRTGQWARLEAVASGAVRTAPGHPQAWKALGRSLLNLGRPEEARKALARALECSKGDLEALHDMATALWGLGLKVESESACREALEVHPEAPAAHLRLGSLLSFQCRMEEAEPFLREAIRLDPRDPAARHALGTHLARCQRLEASVDAFREALALRPDHLKARLDLGAALAGLSRFQEALDVHRQAVASHPASTLALRQLANLLIGGGQHEEAARFLEQAAILEPRNPAVLRALAGALVYCGRIAEASDVYGKIHELQPVFTAPAPGGHPAFSVLFLGFPSSGMTPVQFLTSQRNYDAHYYVAVPDRAPRLDLLLVADADSGQEMLPVLQGVVDALGLPTVNPPCKVQQTDRVAIARRLEGIPLVRVPRTLRLPSSRLEATGMAFPLLVRRAGTHGGRAFEKCGDPDALRAFAAREPEADCYVSEFLDCQSADGHTRKYRWISVDGHLFPYHLAIHDGWLVHYFRTDMARSDAKRAEERRFLESPGEVFPAPLMEALEAVVSATGLDYCGVDCALDAQGRLVVFEANAAMLVHDEQEPEFAYKRPHLARIQDAFGAMLARMAGSRAGMAPC
jgi:tetratricopeptide (TPR) repeat protein